MNTKERHTSIKMCGVEIFTHTHADTNVDRHTHADTNADRQTHADTRKCRQTDTHRNKRRQTDTRRHKKAQRAQVKGTFLYCCNKKIGGKADLPVEAW